MRTNRSERLRASPGTISPRPTARSTRGDNPAPLADQFATVAAEYRADGDLSVDFGLTGAPRPVTPEAALAAYRTAQEALTNACKHAPGQLVQLCLKFAPDEIAVLVTNPLPPGTPTVRWRRPAAVMG